MGVGHFRIARILFVVAGCHQIVKFHRAAVAASPRTVMTSARWQVAGYSQRENFPAAEAVVVWFQKALLAAVVVEGAVVRQRVHLPEMVDLRYSQTKTRLDQAAAGSWCFQTIHRLTAQAAGYFQTIPHPGAAESGYSRTESHPPWAAAVGADRIEARPFAFLSPASSRRESLSAVVAGCSQTRRSLLASLQIPRR